MGIITKIERQKNQAPRYNIYIDGAFRFGIHEDVLVKHALSKGMEVNPEEIEAILHAEEMSKVRQAALRYIGHRPRTTEEVRRYLLGKGYEGEPVAEILQEMQRLNYLDDRRFAREWVESRSTSKGYGPRLLRQELEQKGVSGQYIEEALDELDQEEERRLAEQAAEKRYRRLSNQPWPVVERRLGHFLLRRGFPQPLVMDILRRYRSRHCEQEEGWS
ncbi:regulatory protein RecX [Marinithermofilum abyssi]|uniref:Regulatory protein RecX n=1 Tax=Marinithermofilum abyssi TaxID=1571185 RepID=A0A8J2VCA9_9BACL|nr:RecX family transcriptional regulator [Marinithermofilum abyssi]GGE24839.1 regulatory protein RecX [Marinithermofilum abyssi]